DAVAGRDVGVGGVEVDLARTARAEEGRPRREAVHPARLAVEDVGAPADGALAALEKEVDGEVVLVDGDVRRGAHRLAEGADDLAPGASTLERTGETGDAAAEHQEVALDGHGSRASRARPPGSSARHPGEAQRIDLAEGVPYRRS